MSVGLEKRSALERRELFAGSKEYGAGTSAEIEQTCDHDLRRTRTDSGEDALVDRIGSGKAYGKIGGALGISGKGRRRVIPSLVAIGYLGDCLGKTAPLDLI